MNPEAYVMWKCERCDGVLVKEPQDPSMMKRNQEMPNGWSYFHFTTRYSGRRKTVVKWLCEACTLRIARAVQTDPEWAVIKAEVPIPDFSVRASKIPKGHSVHVDVDDHITVTYLGHPASPGCVLCDKTHHHVHSTPDVLEELGRALNGEVG